MNLYYTTSVDEDDEQQLPQLSLGGYKSSTLVKNDEFDNLFGEISLLTVQQNRSHYVAIIAVNETEDILTNCEIWLNPPEDALCKIEIAVVDVALDKKGVRKMERVKEMFHKPYVGDFQEYTEDNKGFIGDIGVGEYVGIWFKRSLIKERVNDVEEEFYEPDPTRQAMFREKEVSTDEAIDLCISWD